MSILHSRVTTLEDVNTEIPGEAERLVKLQTVLILSREPRTTA